MINIKKYHRKLIKPYLFLCFFLVFSLSIIGISYSYYSDTSNAISNIKTGSLDLTVLRLRPVTIDILDILSENTNNTENINSETISDLDTVNSQDNTKVLEDTSIKFLYHIRNNGTVPVSLVNYTINLNGIDITNLYDNTDMCNIIPNTISAKKNKLGSFKLEITEALKKLLVYNGNNTICIKANYNQTNSQPHGWNQEILIKNNVIVNLMQITPNTSAESSNKNDSIKNSPEKGGYTNNEN